MVKALATSTDVSGPESDTLAPESQQENESTETVAPDPENTLYHRSVLLFRCEDPCELVTLLTILVKNWFNSNVRGNVVT